MGSLYALGAEVESLRYGAALSFCVVNVRMKITAAGSPRNRATPKYQTYEYGFLRPTDRYAALGGGWTGELSFGFLNALDLLGEDFMGRRVHP